MRRRGRMPRPAVDDGWTSEVSSGFALAGFLFLVFIGFTALALGPLMAIDAYMNIGPPPREWLPFLLVLDRIGQRAVCLPLLAVVGHGAHRHHVLDALLPAHAAGRGRCGDPGVLGGRGAARGDGQLGRHHVEPLVRRQCMVCAIRNGMEV